MKRALMAYVISEDPDQSAHPCSLIRTFSPNCLYLVRAMRKRVFGHMRTAKAQISLPHPRILIRAFTAR